ncbi:MAG: inorganic diphosphatase [Deltaproteobacteria bacterium]|nr:inorganic diphosphatase [Deltaproteobacteria bacterium]
MRISSHALTDLPAFDEHSSTFYCVIESPRGSQIKFKYIPLLKSFAVSYILPAGSMFPRDFGFIPSTLGRDGDPVDILVFLDAPTFTGCIIPTRIIGAIEAEQTQDGDTFRNDRLIGIAAAAHEYARIESIDDLDPIIVKEIEHFYVSYNEMRGRHFKPLARSGPGRALELITKGMRAFAAKHDEIGPR